MTLLVIPRAAEPQRDRQMADVKRETKAKIDLARVGGRFTFDI